MSVEELVDKNITNKIYIPNDKVAKLMYYLKCVFTVIQSDIQRKYINYNDFYLITKSDEEKIIELINLFKPTIMKNLNLFRIEPDFVPIDKENEFYDISDERFADKINPEVTIGE